MRGVADRFAEAGYLAIAPALFDRDRPGIELGYTPADIEKGRDHRAAVGWDGPLMDVAAAMKEAAKAGKTGTVGYCWGGSVAFLSATRLNPAATVCYYGGQIAQHKDEKPHCPVMMHFGEKDGGIPMADVEAVKAARPDSTVHVYDAGHGFNCDQRGDYDESCAATALDRTLAFFAEHVG